MDAHRTTILVIDDEESIRQSLRLILLAKGFQVLVANSGEAGLQLAAEKHPALVILDLRMPGLDGFKTCEKLRAWYHEPIMILSVLKQDKDMIAAFQSGADDYITKPFVTAVLLAHIDAHLRRIQQLATPSLPPVIVAGALHIDQQHRCVTIHDQVVHLTPIEYSILALLANQADCVVTTSTLQQHLWGESGDEVNTNALHAHIAHLRKKITILPEYVSPIQTERGIGFRFVSRETGRKTAP